MFSQKKTWENVSLTKTRLFKRVTLTNFFVAFPHYLFTKKMWKCFAHVTHWIIFDRFPGYFQLYFSICDCSNFFHTRFSQKILWKCTVFRSRHFTDWRVATTDWSASVCKCAYLGLSTVGNPVANSHPCMLLGRINSWPCKKS